MLKIHSLLAPAVTLAMLSASAITLADGESIGSVRTSFQLLGPNHTIEVERFDDPKVNGVSCYISYAKKGGISGAIGMAENSSDASVACRQTDHIAFDESELPDQEEVFTQRRSPLFKNLRVVRMHDANLKTFIYLTYSNKLIDGSPKNSISAVHYGSHNMYGQE